jgi:hypothetical protein
MKPEEAVEYLVQVGLLDPARMVGSGIEVRDATRRNANLRVAYRDGDGFFLKQPSPGESSPAMLAEVGFYRQSLRDHRLTPLRRLIPRFRRYDPELRLLVLDLCRGQPAADYVRSGQPLPAIGRELAEALALCHGAVRASSGEPQGDGLFDTSPPLRWLATPGPSLFQEVGPAQLDIVRLVQSRPEVQRRIEHLVAGWTRECLIHGDLRWDNLVVEPAPDGGEGPAIRILDWESAGMGDPAWDVGCVLFAFVAGCLDAAGASSAELDVVRSEFARRTGEAQGDVQAFWRGYLGRSGLDGPGADRLADRVAVACGARLIQHALELTPRAVVMPGPVVLVLQLAVNLLSQPRDAVGVLFGIAGASGDP